MNREEQFTNIYKKNDWGGIESVSGRGSDIIQTTTLSEKLIELINPLNIDTIVDICGDFNWMKHTVNKLNIKQYIGIDIVKELIDNLNFKYSDNKIKFVNCDIVTDPLPKGDLLLCRDCLVHLTYNSIFSFLNNFIKSDIKYLLTTTFIDRGNSNLKTDGDGWFPLCLFRTPFNFSNPILLINEQCTEGNNNWTDKSLGLWSREQIKEIINDSTI